MTSSVDTEMRAVTKYLLLLRLFLLFRGKWRTTSMDVGKHSFLYSDRHGRNSYTVVENRNSCCTWSSITLPLKSCYLHSTEFGQERERAFLVLKMCLIWMSSTSRKKHLCSMFAMTQGCVSFFLDLGMTGLHRCLRQLPWVRIEWPSSEEITEFCSMISC